MSSQNELSPSFNDKLILENSIYNMLGAGIPLALSAAVIPLTIRLMGLERFAILSLLWAALKLATIPGVGYAEGLVRHIAHELGGPALAHRLSAVIKTSFLLQLAVSVLTGCLLWAGAGWLAGGILKFKGPLRQEAIFAFKAAAVILPVHAAGILFSAVLAAYQRFRTLNAVKLASECLCLCLPPAVFAAGAGIRELAAAILGAQLLSATAYFLLMRAKGMWRETLSAPTDLLGELSGYAGKLTLARISMIGAEEWSRFIGAALCGMPGLVLYNVPHEIYTSLALIPSSFLLALFPAYSAACAREKLARLGAYFYGYAAKLFLLTALAFSGLIIFAPEILLILTGAVAPDAAVRILQLLAFAAMAAGTNYVGMGWFNGLNRPGVPARIHAASLALFLPACWAAVKYLGITGAAAAMAGKILLENAFYLAAAEKAGAGSGRTTFIAAAAGAFALAAVAARLSRALPLGSFYKTAFFMASLAGTAALLCASIFLRSRRSSGLDNSSRLALT